MINTVISYKNAWNDFRRNNPEEYQDIIDTLPIFLKKYSLYKSKNHLTPTSTIWEGLLNKKGWNRNNNPVFTKDGQRVIVGNFGPIKNNVSAYLSNGNTELLNRWLFQRTTLAVKFQLVNLPILIVPTQILYDDINEPRTSIPRLTIEECIRTLQPLSPLSHSFPFLIIGYSHQTRLLDIDVIEIEADPLVNSNSDVVIDRCIEFPSEYYQAGLNILSYFGSYLREQYPDESASVKIEQNGQLVRLVIETEDGKKEVVEKALEEYQLIVSGQKRPEEITNNQKLILELNSELRIAKYRIETQQDIINVQSGQIEKLFSMIGNGLVSKSQVNIDFKPIISLSNNTVINNDIADILSCIEEIKDLIPISSPEYIEVQDLEEALKSIESEKNPETVQKSSAMKKIKKFIDTLSEGNTEVSKALKLAESGWETFKKLAGRYNKIAEWCGLPQIPSVFTK